MLWSFKVRDHLGCYGEEFIKLDARWRDGFRLGDGQTLVVENNATKEKLYLEDNNAVQHFIDNDYLKVWDPLEEHRALKANKLEVGSLDASKATVGPVSKHDPNSFIPEGAQLNTAKIADGKIIGAKYDIDFDAKVNPKHYQGYFKDYQWFEVMQELLPDVNSAALSMVYKYLARSGKKDDPRQEALKALWYLKFMTARLIAGRNIRVAEVDDILNSAK